MRSGYAQTKTAMMVTAHRTTNNVRAISRCVSSVLNFVSACNTLSTPAIHPVTCAPHSRSQNLAPPRTRTIRAENGSGTRADARARAGGTTGGTSRRDARIPVRMPVLWVIRFSIRARQVGPRLDKWLTAEQNENNESVARVHLCPGDDLGRDVCAKNVHSRCFHCQTNQRANI